MIPLNLNKRVEALNLAPIMVGAIVHLDGPGRPDAIAFEVGEPALVPGCNAHIRRSAHVYAAREFLR